MMVSLDTSAPDFKIDSTKGKISLSDYRNRWVVLFAYPADFTPICEADILGFARKKTEFDKLGVQFLGWSVDTVESHNNWIKKLKETTGVQIDYPIIADVDKKLAETYGILHRSKGVTYRGVFIIDPEGIMKFAATYPLDVGRNTNEVERIVKVLQRARELSSLKELERAKELSKYNR
jgi:peroxiredoxin (alkyl hydroperoxide reductase subunit C)